MTSLRTSGPRLQSRRRGSRARAVGCWAAAASIALGCSVALGVADPAPPVQTRDTNGDGRPDVWMTSTAEHTEIAAARGHDGVVDYWRLVEHGHPRQEWVDRNHDGRVDAWGWFTDDGKKQWVALDKNFDGRPDAWFYYGAKGEGAPGAPGSAISGIVRPVAGELDDDCDGKPDRTIGTMPKTRPTPDDPPASMRALGASATPPK